MIRLGNEVLITLAKTLTFVDADANADAAADAGGSTIALRECCSGELKTTCIRMLSVTKFAWCFKG